MIQLARHGVRFGNLFRFETFSFEHIQEISVPPKIKLVGAIQPNAALTEQSRQQAMSNGCAYLRFDVVADQWKSALFEPIVPIILRRDEHGNTINKSTTGLEHLLDIPLGGHLRTDGQIRNNNIGAG